MTQSTITARFGRATPRSRAPRPTDPARLPRTDVVVGGEPRVDLLPAEVHTDRRQRDLARRAWLGVAGVGVVVALAVGAAGLHTMQATTRLSSAEAETNSLLQQQQQFAPVRVAEQQSALIEAGQEVAGATEVDWQSYVSGLRGVLPPGVTITTLGIETAGPLAPYPQASTPLQGRRIGTVTATVTSTTIPSGPEWTDSISGLQGYVDSTISSITRQSSGNGYTADITVHIDERAYDGVYTKAK